jgi:GNAT superfamily N-acetyltransferase
MITVARLSLPDARVPLLTRMADAEGFNFLDRLETDWVSGENRFDRAGEILLGAHDGAALIAIGGLNIDPFGTPNCGRLRRVYVVPSHRGCGVGKLLVGKLLDHARQNFGRARLRTDTECASQFYLRLGFHRIDDPNATHERAFP